MIVAASTVAVVAVAAAVIADALVIWYVSPGADVASVPPAPRR